MPNKDWEHPELQVGEVFLGNIRKDLFPDLTWKTKRQGDILYNAEEESFLATDFLPVFVQRAEMVEEGLPDEIIDKSVY